MSWDITSLDKIVTFQRGFDLPITRFKSGLVPVVGSTNIIGYHNEFKVSPPGIVTGRSGTLGNFQYLNEKFWPHNTTLWVKDFKGNIPKYVYYLLKTLNFSYLNGGSSVPTLNRNVLKSIHLKYTSSLQTQKRVADVLSNYDDLIENNLKRIHLLEQAAQNIYKEWFVNMRFPGFESASINNRGIYEGWEEVKIGELLNHEIGGGWGKEKNEGDFHNPAFVIRGTDFPDIETGSLENIPFRFHKKSNLSTRKLVAGDIIFEVSGGSTNVGVARSLLVTEKLIANLGNDAMCASFCKLMRPKSICHSYFLFLTLKHLKTTKVTEVYEKRSASNIVNYNWKAFLSDVIILIPNQVLLTRFFTIIKKNIEMQDVLRSQISHLKSARDILLPRLMNQTIEV